MSLICFAALFALTGIIRTIKTHPGGIPEDKEWDMQSDSSVIEHSSEDDNKSDNDREEKKE